MIAFGDCMFVQTVKVTAQTNILLHAQNITNNRNIFFRCQMLTTPNRTNWKDLLVVVNLLEFVSFVPGIVTGNMLKICKYFFVEIIQVGENGLTSRRNRSIFPHHRIQR